MIGWKSLSDLREAQAQIQSHVHRTPLWPSRNFSRMAGCSVYLKAELFQKTGSYKPRGMLWRLLQLSPEQKAAGVITFSAGNAAQGLAYAASIVGTRATVVMPQQASPAKAEATRGYGGEVIRHGTAAECFTLCLELSEKRGLTFVPSYDDETLMAGHASLGLEILDELPDVGAVFVAIGGGGMMGGLAMALHASGLKARLIGVEPEGAPAMYRSLKEGHAVKLDEVKTVADGLAAPSAGERCYALARERLEKIVLVSDEQILESMKLLMSRAKLMAEPAGAAALAGLLAGGHGLSSGDQAVVIVSGGNLDLAQLKQFL
jgi:threonine dehydratase